MDPTRAVCVKGAYNARLVWLRCAHIVTASLGRKNNFFLVELLEGMLKFYDTNGDGFLSRRIFLKLLAERGLMPDDPRLAKMFEKLSTMPLDESSNTLKALARVAAFGGNLVADALGSRLSIPDFTMFQKNMRIMFEDLREENSGVLSNRPPALQFADPTKFAVSVCTIDGQRFSLGDYDHMFTLQSLASPFIYGAILEDRGENYIYSRVGREPSGLKYDAIELKNTNSTDDKLPKAKPHNPLINAGAILCTSLLNSTQNVPTRLKTFHGLWADVCAREKAEVSCDTVVMLSERSTSSRSRALAYMLRENNCLDKTKPVEETLELFFSINSTMSCSDDLAVAAATLANAGVNPLHGNRVFSEESVRMMTSVLLSCGMYDASGEWAFSIGVPAKASASGALMLVIPGICGIAIYSPLLNEKRVSVRGLALAQEISKSFATHHLEKLSPVVHKNSLKTRWTHQHCKADCELLTAAAAGDDLTLCLLISRGGNINTKDYDSRTPLHLAAAEGRLSTVSILLKQNANPILKDRWGKLPVESAEESSTHDENIIKKLTMAATVWASHTTNPTY
eukprot:m.199349 g.199349  ORF g.199349 m.199349 type:complete len:568 (-) comp15726_c1_seq2:2175-3878(-)